MQSSDLKRGLETNPKLMLTSLSFFQATDRVRRGSLGEDGEEEEEESDEGEEPDEGVVEGDAEEEEEVTVTDHGLLTPRFSNPILMERSPRRDMWIKVTVKILKSSLEERRTQGSIERSTPLTLPHRN